MSTQIVPQRDYDKEELRNDYGYVDVWDGKKYQRKLLLSRKADLTMKLVRLHQLKPVDMIASLFLQIDKNILEKEISDIDIALTSLGLVNR